MSSVSQEATQAGPAFVPTPSSQSRFVPGQLFSGRYRIVALVGRGGMGEVYRADDLKLGQPVALKFLPLGIDADPSRLSHLLNEVRTARQIAHPNVCRVYDVGEIEGQHFLSMEYVDGEDLDSLLRRIHRMPGDRGVQIARQIASGLAAAHEAGILHRDLKPANIMIDGRGHVRITDFGLASAAAHIAPGDLRAGTPAYMAPEQRAGREVSVRSDLYALGLVLFEMVTGRMPFPEAGLKTPGAAVGGVPPAPSNFVRGLDPEMERIIVRCLDPDPERRPPSARAVVEALPGRDLLEAALAAGETPSPEVVAAAGETGVLRPGRAALLLAACVAGLWVVIGLSSRSLLVAKLPLEKPPGVLVQEMRDLIGRLGRTDEPADILAGFDVNDSYLKHLQENRPSREDLAQVLAAPQPGVGVFRYRQSPFLLERNDPGTIGNWFWDPSPYRNGMIDAALDLRGRLLWIRLVPLERAVTAEAGAEPDWDPLFAAAGIDPRAVRPAEPQLGLTLYADRVRAWEGAYPESPSTPILIEAASAMGQPVFFDVIEPWDRPVRPGAATPPVQGFLPARIARTIAFLLILVAAVFVALRNIRLGRGDRRGAFRFAVYMAAIRLLWMLGAHHFATDAELNLVVGHLAWSSYRFLIIGLFYLALEPYARRIWPRMLVSWVRLLDGRLRDPLVGRDALVGCLFGIAGALWTSMLLAVGSHLPRPVLPEWPGLWTLEALGGLRHAVSSLIAIHTMSMMDTLYFVMFLLFLKLALRRTAIAVTLTVITGFIVYYNPAESLAFNLVLATVSDALLLVCLFRFGLLPFLLSATVGAWLRQVPLTTDLSSWHAPGTLITLAVMIFLALWAARTALGPGLRPGTAPV